MTTAGGDESAEIGSGLEVPDNRVTAVVVPTDAVIAIAIATPAVTRFQAALLVEMLS